MAGEREATQTSGKKAASNGKGPEEPKPMSDVERLIAQQAEAPQGLDGFEQVTVEIDAFYNPIIEMPIPGIEGGKREVKCQLQGIPFEKRERKANPSEPEKAGGVYYLVRVTREMLAVTEKKDSNGFKEVRALKPGDVVWVDQRFDFRIFDRCIPHFDMERKRIMGAEVFAKPTNKIALKTGGRTKWNFDVRARILDTEQLKAHGFGGFGSFAERRALAAGPTQAVVEGEEIPF